MAICPDEFKTLGDSLERDGWCVSDRLFPADMLLALAEQCQQLDEQDQLTRAGIGRGGSHMLDRRVRGDRTRWLDTRHSALQAQFLEHMHSLRITLNRRLLLGMESFEAHYALYPPGTFYARHRDRFQDDDARVLSAVLYLNQDWAPADGGALRLYLPDGGHHDVLPQHGRLALFLSAQFDHEVLPTRRERISIAGWFRRRTLRDAPPTL
ncbi:2OG-Fe(II) oxygenase [Oleiagrimonas sp. C23AA]|uniref:2OG-Fe(II) oxygenase n=1 Tax=Oleiagrimonas sp. C23AA TaxID=2719047 RepID=UPI0014245928|nr:2OG-Fe(II) oxygenase [Oleiagrimonas sp. C23AA]NII10068.1 2OG-Fe(II) oxygenase [Oleiagrimonas sp. C23AA]